MKKTLTAAVALASGLGFAGAANAVDVNPDGLGQVLLYSYYTVENGNDTLINITNTVGYNQSCASENVGRPVGQRFPCPSGVKAVKVRILEAMNSQEVLDFNLYLSPNDVWTAAISRTEDGAKLSTADKSCTVPAIPAGGVEFRNFQYEGDDYSDGRGGPQGLDRTRSGYIEVIEMGEILDYDYPIPNTAPQQYFSIADWATHINGVPPLCAGLSILWAPTASDNSNIWTLSQGTFSMTGPSGGLYGSAVIVNVEGGTDVAYDAVAIEEFNYELLHTNPGDLLPSLNQAQPYANLPDGQYFEVAPFRPNVDAVSAVLTKARIMNDYLTVSALAASTDWVVTFPTKRFYVNTWEDLEQGVYVGTPPFREQNGGDTDGKPDYEHVLGQQKAFLENVGNYNSSVSQYWTGPFRTWWTDASVGGVEGSACEAISIEYWDQEEGSPRTPPGQIDFSPQPPPSQVPGNFLCYEANVISVNGSDILGSPYTRTELNLADGWDAGWIRISFDNDPYHQVPSYDGRYGEYALIGLPVTGFAVQAFVNGDVGGLLSNYAGLTAHKAQREERELPYPFSDI